MLVVKTRAPTSRARFLLMAAFLLGDAVWLPATPALAANSCWFAEPASPRVALAACSDPMAADVSFIPPPERAGMLIR